MKIALFTNTYPPSVNGVANVTHFYRLGLTDRGHDVHVFAPAPLGEDPFEGDPAVHRYPAFRCPGELDYMIVDLPPGTGDAQLSLAQSVPLTGAVIVTQPQSVAVDDARRGLAMFEKLNVPILGVIENMSGDLFGAGGGEQLAQERDVPFLGRIPLTANVRVGGDSGHPVVADDPDSEAGQAFHSVAQAIAARVSVLLLTSQNTIPLNVIK